MVVAAAERQWQVSTIGIWSKGNKSKQYDEDVSTTNTDQNCCMGIHTITHTHYTTYTASSNAAMGKVP